MAGPIGVRRCAYNRAIMPSSSSPISREELEHKAEHKVSWGRVANL